MNNEIEKCILSVHIGVLCWTLYKVVFHGVAHAKNVVSMYYTFKLFLNIHNDPQILL